MKLFATVLTYPAPCSNYGGETELNRLVIQKVTGPNNQDYPIFSPESIRNALREILRGYGLPSNRRRIHPVAGRGRTDDGGDGDKQQLAVQFEKYPDPDSYIDDFVFGYLLAVKGEQLNKVRREKGEKYPLKRDSILRMNLAKALVPYRHNAVFSQSPQINPEGIPWKPGGGDSKSGSGLLHREVVDGAFQYPFALNLDDCRCTIVGCDHQEPEKDERDKPKETEQNKNRLVCKQRWTRELLKAIGELNGVAGKQTRSFYDFAPASIIVRLTTSLIAGYQTYCFKPDGRLPDVIEDILAGDFDKEVEVKENGRSEKKKLADEFYIGGEIVKRGLTDKQVAELKAKGVTMERNPQRLLAMVAVKFLGGE
jgi:CRISPR-associated protein Cst2